MMALTGSIVLIIAACTAQPTPTATPSPTGTPAPTPTPTLVPAPSPASTLGPTTTTATPRLWLNRLVGANSVHLLDYLGYGWSIEKNLVTARESGLNVLRIHLDYTLKVPRRQDDPTLEELRNSQEKRLEIWDQVLDLAAKNDLRILLDIADACCRFTFRSEQEYYARKHPSGANVNDEQSRRDFKEWMRQVVTRTNTVNGRIYRDDPTIIAWDISNEPQFLYLGQSCVDFQAWLEDVSSYLRQLDPSHPITVGLDQNSAMEPGCLQLVSPFVDFLSLHWYPSPKVPTFAQIVALFQQIPNKPFVVEEYGLHPEWFVRGGKRPSPDLPPGYVESFRRDMDTAFCAGALAFMFWEWGIPETRNPPVTASRPPPFWVGSAHDINDTAFVDMIKNYQSPC